MTKAVTLINLLLILTLLSSGCATVEIPDFKAHVTLPASGDGFYVKTVSDEEGRIPKSVWDEERKRGIIILPEDWSVLRYTILKNCLTMECKNAVGTFDNLFETIDKALRVDGAIKN